MGKIEDVTGVELHTGDYVAVQGWRGLEIAQVRKFSTSCMICDYTFVHTNGTLVPSRLQPYLPNHSQTSSNENYPNRMLKVLKIEKEQYDRHYKNL